MQSKADVVIVGGGIIGLSVAFYLARENIGRIVLVEKDRLLGTGSTSKAAGGIRAQFSTEINVRMSMLSEKLFCRFEEDTGSKALFDQVGYMFLLSDISDVASFKQAAEMQRSLGLDVELLTADEIPRLAPHVRVDDIKLATFCAQDGLGDPHEFLSGYEHAARRMGVSIEFNTQVIDIETTSDKINKIKTTQGEIGSPLVVNCTGAFAAQIAEMVGGELPVKPFPRQCVTTGELDFVEQFFPMVVDVKSGLYCHKESKGLLLGWADKDTKSTFDTSIDPDYTDNILERALDRMPMLETAEVANQWSGLYETTPDHHAIIGWETEVEGMFHVTGFSGHGFMHAPAAGLVTAELIMGKEPSIDISSLSPERFARGAMVEETNVI